MQYLSYGDAAKRFDAVVARIGSDSVIGMSAVLNRGCLFDASGEKDRAVQAFTAVIESKRATDEMRACALNNRANIFFERGEHEKSIRDRSTVLSFTSVSADRRFVALFGRSESHFALNNHQAAIADVCLVLKAKDIPRHDRLCARLWRAALLNSAGHREQSRIDLHGSLDALLSSKGVSEEVDSQIKKAEEARRAGNFELAHKCLTDAENEIQEVDGFDIRALIVHLVLAEDENKADDARQAWRQLNEANRNSARRMRIAQISEEQD
jgi:tetratricopeptide (TPR) repeat protein